MIILFIYLFLIACSEKVEYRQAKVQKSYTVKNSHGTFKVYVQNHFIFDKEGIASYYSSGHTTATNEPFNPNYLTAAHPYVPLPCVAEVSLVAKPWKKVIVKINDRGPFTKDKRIIDLSYGAAQKLGFIKEGLAKVRVKILIKETLKLKEHGGTIVWKGERPFTELS